MFTTTVVFIAFTKKWRAIVTFPSILLNRKPSRCSILVHFCGLFRNLGRHRKHCQQYARQFAVQEPAARAFLISRRPLPCIDLNSYSALRLFSPLRFSESARRIKPIGSLNPTQTLISKW